MSRRDAQDFSYFVDDEDPNGVSRQATYSEIECFSSAAKLKIKIEVIQVSEPSVRPDFV